MHQLFFFVRIYPYWAIPICILVGQVGIHFRRRHSKLQWTFWGLIATLLATSVLWIVFRGDLHSDEWVRMVFSSG